MPHAYTSKMGLLGNISSKGYFFLTGIHRLVGRMLVGVLVKGEQFHMRIST